MTTPYLKSRRRWSPLVAAALAAAAFAGVAVAGQAGDSTQQRLATAAVAKQPAAVPGSTSDAFAVLRAPGRTVDDGVAGAFAKAPQYSAAFAPNPSLAQPLPQTNPYTNSNPWLVPGDDALCLYVPDTEGAATTCNTLDEAKAGELHLVLTPFGSPAFVVGVVPDGVTSVEATRADGSVTQLAVSANSYSIRTSDIRTIKAGDTEFSVPQAPTTPPPVSTTDK
jgi:hypothetical protein